MSRMTVALIKKDSVDFQHIEQFIYMLKTLHLLFTNASEKVTFKTNTYEQCKHLMLNSEQSSTETDGERRNPWL